VVPDGQGGGVTDALGALPPIQTGRLALRVLVRDDAAALQELTDDPAITAVIHFLPKPFTRVDAERLILGDGYGRDVFLGAWSRDAQLVAVVGCHLHGVDEIEIGYWVRASLHGRGLATEAVNAVIAMLRRAFPACRIMAECRRANIASWGLLEKLGFRAAGQAGMRPGRQRLILSDAVFS
jgi:RimJ/RimL family protein N-acetyltransferase